MLCRQQPCPACPFLPPLLTPWWRYPFVCQGKCWPELNKDFSDGKAPHLLLKHPFVTSTTYISSVRIWSWCLAELCLAWLMSVTEVCHPSFLFSLLYSSHLYFLPDLGRWFHLHPAIWAARPQPFPRAAFACDSNVVCCPERDPVSHHVSCPAHLLVLHPQLCGTTTASAML